MKTVSADGPRMCRIATLLAALLYGLVVGAGCSTTKSTNTPRTGTEQLLISSAVDQALGRVDFKQFEGKKVFLEEKYMDSVDKNYVLASIRHHILRNGGSIVTTADAADLILEARSGGIGTDTAESFVGTPQFSLPGMVALPEVRLIEKRIQSGTAKIGLVAYDAKQRVILGDGGVSVAQSHDNNWYVLGMGPYREGTINGELQSSANMFLPSDLIPKTIAFGLLKAEQEPEVELIHTDEEDDGESSPIPAPIPDPVEADNRSLPAVPPAGKN